MHYHPSGLQIHKNERRSAVRLKHRGEGQTAGGSSLNKTTQHTVSHGAGVLLGNMQHYGVEQEFLRELNNSNTSGNLKSVYDMRLSHSRQSNRPTAGKSMTQKRKHLQSAVTRSHKPNNLTTGEL